MSAQMAKRLKIAGLKHVGKNIPRSSDQATHRKNKLKQANYQGAFGSPLGPRGMLANPTKNLQLIASFFHSPLRRKSGIMRT
jgi:hypothetical protein